MLDTYTGMSIGTSRLIISILLDHLPLSGYNNTDTHLSWFLSDLDILIFKLF
jgi:hypothetical protein